MLICLYLAPFVNLETLKQTLSCWYNDMGYVLTCMTNQDISQTFCGKLQGKSQFVAGEGEYILWDNTHPWTIVQPWQTSGTMLKVQDTINPIHRESLSIYQSVLGAQSSSLESCCRCATFQGEICSKGFAYEAISSFSCRFFSLYVIVLLLGCHIH
jgi:hypothetical protein